MKFKQRNFVGVKIDIVVKETNIGYTAYAKNILGCVSTGETSREAIENLKEMINNYLGFESNVSISLANSETLNIAG